MAVDQRASLYDAPDIHRALDESERARLACLPKGALVAELMKRHSLGNSDSKAPLDIPCNQKTRRSSGKAVSHGPQACNAELKPWNSAGQQGREDTWQQVGQGEAKGDPEWNGEDVKIASAEKRGAATYQTYYATKYERS